MTCIIRTTVVTICQWLNLQCLKFVGGVNIVDGHWSVTIEIVGAF